MPNRLLPLNHVEQACCLFSIIQPQDSCTRVCVCVSRIPEVESQTGDKEMKVTNGCKAKGLVVILWLLQSG